MRFGPFEILTILVLLAGLIWIIYQLTCKTPVTTWDAQQRELQDLRRRLAALQTNQHEQCDATFTNNKGED